MSDDSFKVINVQYEGCKNCSNLRIVTFGNTIIECCSCNIPNPPMCVLYKTENKKEK